MKRVLSFVLCVVVVLTLFPLRSFANDIEEEFYNYGWSFHDVGKLPEGQIKEYTSDNYKDAFKIVVETISDSKGICTDSTGNGLACVRIFNSYDENDHPENQYMYLFYIDNELDDCERTPIKNNDSVQGIHEQVWFWTGSSAKLIFNRCSFPVRYIENSMSFCGDYSIYYTGDRIMSVCSGGRQGVNHDNINVISFDGEKVITEDVVAHKKLAYNSYTGPRNDEESLYMANGWLKEDDPQMLYIAAEYYIDGNLVQSDNYTDEETSIYERGTVYRRYLDYMQGLVTGDELITLSENKWGLSMYGTQWFNWDYSQYDFVDYINLCYP